MLSVMSTSNITSMSTIPLLLYFLTEYSQVLQIRGFCKGNHSKTNSKKKTIILISFICKFLSTNT